MRFLVALALVPALCAALHNGQALTPIMGWSTRFVGGKNQCSFDETTLRAIAEQLEYLNLRTLGFRTMILHDCLVSGRDADGAPVVDTARFPSGIERLSNSLQTLGLVFGVTTDVGPTTCQGYTGSAGYAKKDAVAFVRWGAGLVRMTSCSGGGQRKAQALSDAVQAVDSKVVMMFSNNGSESSPHWADSLANAWATTTPIDYPTLSHDTIMKVFDKNAKYADRAGPGGWNDPDVLVIGLPENEALGLTARDEKLQYILWAISAAPMILAVDPRSMPQYALEIVSNTEIIGINQDPLGMQAVCVFDDGKGHQVWAKRMQTPKGVDVAVALLNRQEEAAVVHVTWDEIGLEPNDTASVRDVVARQDRGNRNGYYSAAVPAKDVVLLRIKQVL
eukprot:m51a1_g9292 putative alpha-galactosidase (391) ;mRNA; r:33352-34981